MNTELTPLWNKVLGEIKKSVSKGTYATLFKQTHLISLDETKATVGVPSVMLINLLRSRFLLDIKKLLDAFTGREIAIVFIPRSLPTSEKNPKETPLFGLPTTRSDFSKTSDGRRTDSEALAGKQGYAGHAPFRPGYEEQAGQGSNTTGGSGLGQMIGHLTRVRADFTFANFAVSSTNQLAFVSAQNVARNTGKSYNPFFIYGPVGVGKTHLMHAIANDVYKREPNKKIIYITSEEFTNEVVEAIRNNETAKMKRRFRSAYVLLIDDIQFIAGKEKVQEELFHTFNILIDSGSQIVLSSDRPPQEIKKLEKRLSSRFSGGLSVDIEAPDFELKAAIILIKAKKYGYDLPIDVAKMLAENAEDTRSLEGLLLRIITQATAADSPISYEMAKQTLKGAAPEGGERLHAEDIIRHVCNYYNVKSTQLKGPKRDAGLVRARHVAMYLLKQELRLTQSEVGYLLGGRDHTTIMHGVDKIRLLVENQDIVIEDIKGIIKQFRV